MAPINVETDVRPEDLKNYLGYLDRLQESGLTNMFGAATYLRPVFNIDARLAYAVLEYWMENFGKEDE